MGLTVLTQASSGATRNAGTYGDLTTLLDWGLSGREGWTTAFTGTNQRIYQSTSGYLLYVDHTSNSGNAGLAIIRGCESASSISVRTDEFPTVAQVGNTLSNWLVSTAASTTTRDFVLKVRPDSVEYWSRADGTYWEHGFFGLPGLTYGSDVYGVLCEMRGVSNAALGYQSTPINNGVGTSSGRHYWMRDRSGAIKSSRGSLSASGATLGSSASSPPARGGLSNLIMREKIGVSCIGSSSASAGSLSQINRGWIPDLWQPQHAGNGGIADGTTFTDTPYASGSLFRMMHLNAGTFMISEETDTWSVPIG